MKAFEKLKKIPFFPICAIVVLILAFALLWTNFSGSNHSKPSMLLHVNFEGEYKIADGEFKPIVKGEKISSTSGDVTLRGKLILATRDGDVIGGVCEGMKIAFYFHHIGGEITVSGHETHIFDSENPQIGESACGNHWIVYNYEGATDDIVTIILRNHHSFGNETAVNEFLDSMRGYSSGAFETMVLSSSVVYRTVGYILMIIGFVLLGIATYSSLLHIKQGRPIWFFGLAVFFSGVFFLMSDPNVSLLNLPAALSTTALGLSFMLYFISVVFFMSYFVEGKSKIIAKTAAVFSAVITALTIIISLFSKIYFYDTYFVWCILQSVVALVMLVLAIRCIVKGDKNSFFVHAPIALVMPAFLVDIIAVALGWWRGGVASEIAFCILFMSLLFLVLKVLPNNIRAAMREKELLVERKELQAELKQSRFSIMISQIQPHFLYNTLNAIYHLCGKDPQLAQNAVSTFSDYLRNNLDSLDYKGLVTFDKELQHIKTYLKLEKLRFGDELEIIYDIKTSAFSLPIMSVQPMVENAVKHGVFNRIGGGTVKVATSETDENYVVTVEDTGVGFDVEHYADDGKKHIGIENVRQRLSTMCDATLEIVSEQGKGTIVTITIPKT